MPKQKSEQERQFLALVRRGGGDCSVFILLLRHSMGADVLVDTFFCLAAIGGLAVGMLVVAAGAIVCYSSACLLFVILVK